MLCRLLSCRSTATERRCVPFGDVNVCGDHASQIDAAMDVRNETGSLIMHEVMFATRYGEAIDPPLDQAARGPAYAHGYKDGTE